MDIRSFLSGGSEMGRTPSPSLPGNIPAMPAPSASSPLATFPPEPELPEPLPEPMEDAGSPPDEGEAKPPSEGDTPAGPPPPALPDLNIDLPPLVMGPVAPPEEPPASSDMPEGWSAAQEKQEGGKHPKGEVTGSGTTLNERHGLPSNLSREIREMLLSGGPTPHMVTVGPTGKDEIVLGGTDRRTQTKKRIERLDSLSRVPRSDLNAHEKEAKLRLLKLESNRRAAQVSRQKKKRYIANLEERAAMMAKHLAALEIENGQLRALLAEVAGKAMPGGMSGGITLPGGGVLEFPLPVPVMAPFSPKSEPTTPKADGSFPEKRNSQKRTLSDMFAK